MTSPLVSVIIPAYNQAAYISDAIQSVLDQTYTNWELIVVDDGSTDATADAVARVSDSRLRYVFQENRGLPGARNTGIRHSSGEYFAFLDADDTFRPGKLAAHLEHFAQNPDTGLSYGSRVEVDAHGNHMWLIRAPAHTSLKSLVLGFPFTINDLLVHRRWVEAVGGFDESFALHSEDRDFYLRLALAGCTFAGIEAFVANRRLHAGRTFTKIPERIETMHRALDTLFDHPECPSTIEALRDEAYAGVYFVWAYHELVQNDVERAHQHLRETVHLNPDVLNDEGRRIVKEFVWASIRDGSEHEPTLKRVFSGLPPDLAWLQQYESWAIGRGYVQRGACEALWGRLAESRALFAEAQRLNAQFDEQLLQNVYEQLFNIETAFGADRARAALNTLSRMLPVIGNERHVRWLHGCYNINQAFRSYRTGQLASVPGSIVRAVSFNPTYLKDRGVLSILFRSLANRIRTSPNPS